MDAAITEPVIKAYLKEIHGRLEEATSIAKAASACAETGNADKAVQNRSRVRGRIELGQRTRASDAAFHGIKKANHAKADWRKMAYSASSLDQYVLVVRFARKKCPIGAGNPHFPDENRRRLGIKVYLAEEVVNYEPVLVPEFPANREKNREFSRFGRGSACRPYNSADSIGAIARIPYSPEQGIFPTDQGSP
jgi:hypothetical protein